MKIRNWLAEDQWQNRWRFRTDYPRKWLLKVIGASHAQPIFRTDSEGDHHCGWEIKGHRLNVYELVPLKELK